MKEKTPISLVLIKLPKSQDPTQDSKKHIDEELLLVETILRRGLRYQDQFLRYKENALVGILAETDETGAQNLQKRVLDSIHHEERLKTILVLSGTATYPYDGEDIQALIKVAESRALGQSQAS